MDFTVTWYDARPTASFETKNIAHRLDAQEYERRFETEIQALIFSLNLITQRSAYEVTMESPDGTRLSGVHLRLRFRETAPARGAI